MIIYRKLKWQEQETNIIKQGIAFFSSLKATQNQEVMRLAEKYNKADFALDYIAKGKRIQYYGGMFDLYNPYPFIEQWRTRLEKIKS